MAFGSDSQNIEIKVTVDGKDASIALQDIAKLLGNLEKPIRVSESAITRFNNALSLAGKAFSTLRSALERADALDDVGDAFDQITAKANVSADVFRNQLGRATGGLISDFKLMKQANEALLSGIRPDEYLAVASAAKTLSDTLGRDLGQTTEELIAQLRTGRGKLIDLAITAEQDVSKGAASAADNITKLVTGFQNAGDRALQAANKNIGFGESIDLINRGLQAIDFTKLMAGFASATKAIQDFTLKAANAFNSLRITDETKQSIEDLKKQVNLDLMFGDVDKARQKFKILQDGLNQNSVLVQVYYDDLKQLADQLGMVEAAQSKTTETSSEYSDQLKALKQRLKEQREAAENAEKAEKKYAEAVHDALEEIEKKQRALVELNSPQGIQGAYNEINNLVDLYKQGFIPTVGQLIEELTKLRTKFLEAGQSAEAFDLATDIANKDMGGSGPKRGMEALAEDWGKILGNSLADALSYALESGDVQGALSGLGGTIAGSIGGALAEDLGTELFGALGASILGPVGGAIGSYLGTALVDGIAGMFGGRDGQGAIRDELDKLFADLLEDNPAQIYIDGTIQQLSDLEFMRGTDAFETGAFDDFLASLPAKAQAAFGAAGIAFAQFVSGAEGQAGQLAAILANNLGGSLNNLQVLIQSLGKSFEELSEIAIEAFLDGELTARQLVDTLNELEELSASGIPGAFGAVEEAFNNFQAAVEDGEMSGRFLVDAIRDIGAEAQELGINTVPALADALINQFGIAASQVEAFMAAMAAAGITSIEGLVNASIEQLAFLAAATQAATAGQPLPARPSFSSPSTTSRGGGGGGSRGASNQQREAEREAQRAADALLRRRQEAIGIIEKEGNVTREHYREVLALLTKRDKLEERIADRLSKGLFPKKAIDRLNELQKILGGSGGDGGIFVNSELLDFAKKFGDDINAIGVAAERAGISFEQMKSSAIDAFLAGGVSAGDALKNVQDAGPGIAGVTGGIDVAMANLSKFGLKGGALTLDALRDLGSESIERGGQTIDDLRGQLLALGQSTDQVEAIYSVLRNAGITDLSQLQSLSNEAGIQALESLRIAGFKFQETTSETLNILKEISEIPDAKEIDIRLNLSAGEISPAIQALFDALGIDTKEVVPGYGAPGDSPGTPNAGGGKKGGGKNKGKGKGKKKKK